MSTDGAQSRSMADVYQQVYESPAFARLVRKRRRFVMPIAAGFMAWYAGYILVAAYAPQIMAYKLLGNITVALVMGILQILSSFCIATWYVRFAAQQTDPEVAGVRRLFDDIRREQRFLKPEPPPEETASVRPTSARSGSGR